MVREAREVRRRIGLTGQFAAVDEGLTGRDNLVLVARLLGAGRAEARHRADELLDAFDLTAAAGRPAGTYSGGMRRRLDLASSFVGDPQVLFLDEPTTGLDPVSRGALWDLVRVRVAEGTTVLLTTQYLEEAEQLADRVIVLGRGRTIADGTVPELKARLGGSSVRARLTDPGRAGAAAAALRRAGLDPVPASPTARSSCRCAPPPPSPRSSGPSTRRASASRRSPSPSRPSTTCTSPWPNGRRRTRRRAPGPPPRRPGPPAPPRPGGRRP